MGWVGLSATTGGLGSETLIHVYLWAGSAKRQHQLTRVTSWIRGAWTRVRLAVWRSGSVVRCTKVVTLYVQCSYCTTGMGDHLRAGTSPRYVTEPTRSTRSCIALRSLNRVPALIGWDKGGNVTAAWWQLTLCDPVYGMRVPVTVRHVANYTIPDHFAYF